MTARAIALFGSSRRYGNTGQLMDHVAARVDVELVNLGSLRIAPYDYEHRNRGDDFEPLMERVLEFEHVVIASPVYWYAVCPAVKCFLDRISDYLDIDELRDAAAAFAARPATSSARPSMTPCRPHSWTL